MVEVVRAGLFRVEPQRALLGLAHLLALVRKQQLERQREGGLFQLSANQVGTGEHVAPLVVATGLQRAAVLLKQLKEVVGLHQHVVELEERESLFQTLLVALRRQHAVHGEQRAHVAQEAHVVQVA